METGSLEKILKSYESPPQLCSDSSGKPIGFDNCFTAFIALFVGITFGLVYFVIELCSKCTGIELAFMEGYDKKDHEIRHPDKWSKLLEHKNDIIDQINMEIQILLKDQMKLRNTIKV
jgi:hypothetical protein